MPSDLEEGLREYNEALNWTTVGEQNAYTAPIRAILYGRKAFFHLKMNRYADAMACCEISSELLPEHLAPLRIMAEIELSRGEYDKTIRHLSKAIAIRTEGPHFWDYANRGLAFLETGNLQEALQDLRIAIELEPQNHGLLSNLGMVFERLGNPTEAWRCYSLALQSDFNSLPARNNRGTLFFAKQNYRQAEQEFLTALRLNPNDAILWFKPSVIKVRDGNVWRMYIEHTQQHTVWKHIMGSQIHNGNVQRSAKGVFNRYLHPKGIGTQVQPQQGR